MQVLSGSFRVFKNRSLSKFEAVYRSENTPAVALVSTLVSDARVEPFVFRNYAFPPRVQPSFKVITATGMISQKE